MKEPLGQGGCSEATSGSRVIGHGLEQGSGDGMEGADWNTLWRINFHSCFLELDIGVGAGIHGEQTQKLGWGETIKQL